MSCLDDETEVWRESTSIACTGSLFVGVRRGQVIAELARTLEVLALVVRTIRVLDFLCQYTRLVSSV